MKVNNYIEELTPREKELLLHLCKGMTTKEVAQICNISVHTVNSHRRNLSAKLHVRTGVELGAIAILKGLITYEEVIAVSEKP